MYNLIKKTIYAVALPALALGVGSCSDEPEVLPWTEVEKIEDSGNGGSVRGFYVLNEGNLGANKATLDYFDYSTSSYYRNIYAESNPNEILELGDAGNDMAIYQGKLFIVVNGSHKVEVLSAANAVKIGQIDVASPRYVAFSGNYVYVSSYVGGEGDKGSVQRFDINTLQPAGSCGVGYCPEEMVIADGKLYVANSYLYSQGIFDDTISIINLDSFSAAGTIKVTPNLHHLRLDDYGRMWATSRGNYADVPSQLICLEKKDGEYAVADQTGLGCTNLALSSDRLIFFGTEYDASWNAVYNFDYFNLSTQSFTNADTSFITDGTASTLQTPYALAIQPSNGDIIITDAKNYVTSGELRCYSAQGKLKWKATTGDIPGHIVFVTE